MARERGLYQTKISRDGKTLYRHLKRVSFYFRNPREIDLSWGPKDIRAQKHLSIRFNGAGVNSENTRNTADTFRLTKRETMALGYFIVSGYRLWRGKKFR